MMTRSHRAKPLPPDDRRRAILAAVIPLLIDRGAGVTTAEMAQASGIAEGTIFRAFPDKQAILEAALRMAMDAAPVTDALERIDPNLPFESQLAEATRILLDRFTRVTALVGALRTLPQTAGGHSADVHQFIADSVAAISVALTALFDRHRDRLTIAPARAAAAFRGLVSANAHPLTAVEDKLTVEEIVSILLSGVTGSAH